LEDNKNFQSEVNQMKNKIKELNDNLNDSHAQNLKYKNKIDVSEVEIKN